MEPNHIIVFFCHLIPAVKCITRRQVYEPNAENNA